ncbi:hypothetical protein KBC55_01880 [Patescibacteria group bacterium]|nr:hypothetical protein [Patescibacteria group bacterium]
MTSIDELLDDILAADPSLAAERESLRPIVAKMVTARDGVTIDENFLFTLKQKLLHMPEQKTSRAPQVLGYLFSAAAGGALVFMLGVPFLYDSVMGGKPLGDFGMKRLVGNISIESMKPGAFGSLGGSNAAGTAEMMTDGASLLSSVAPSTISARPQSGGGVSMDMSYSADEEKMAANNAVNGAVVDSMMIAPYPGDGSWTPTYYRYNYEGDLELNESGLVYRRGSLPGDANGLTSANFGPVDLGAFPGLEVTYFGASQGQDGEGYNVSVDFASGSVSINQNYNYWTRSYEQGGLNAVPAEGEIIAMANDFLNEYNIDLSSYGAPIVNEQAYMALAEAVRIADPYAGSWMNVTYPLVVDGMEVRNSEGSGYGIDVSINLMLGEVSGVNINLPTDLASSSYSLTTDAAVVDRLLERGGLYGYLPTDEEILNTGAQVIDITVGSPTDVLVPHWTYENNVSQMLLVPALSFPIINIPEDAYIYGSAIVIPLAEDIINSYQEPRYDIMPVEPAVLYTEGEAREE